jgi:ribulose-5-phosphate 4-epimerase/fuculose-1-phosphate aldolase
MTPDQGRKHIVQWAKKLHQEGFLSDHQGSLSCRIGGTMLINPRRKSPGALEPDDVILVDISSGSMTTGANPPADFLLHRELYRKHTKFNALVRSMEPNLLTASLAGKTVYPLLDDMAQIVGPSARVAAYNEPVMAKTLSAVIRGMKGRNAVLLSGSGALCAGSDFDDVHAVCQVLMKGCKCVIESECMGGGVRINPIETRVMRLVYKVKYSKKGSE